jgi:hypothetical protein
MPRPGVEPGAVESGQLGQLSSTLVSKRALDINWVKVAVEMVGRVTEVAAKLGVTRTAVYKWIRKGTMRHAAYSHIKRLHELPVEKLTQEVGDDGD